MSTLKVNDIQTTAGLPNRGKILQVVTTQYDTTTSISLGLNTNLPFSVSITPRSTSSNILISCSINGEFAGANVYNTVLLLNRNIGGVNNYISPPSAGSRLLGLANGWLSYWAADNNSTPECYGLSNYLDSPNTTSTISYFPVLSSAGDTYYLNRTVGDVDSTNYERFRSWITVMEVSP